MEQPSLWGIALGGLVLTTGLATVLVMNPRQEQATGVPQPPAVVAHSVRQPPHTLPSRPVASALPEPSPSVPEPTPASQSDQPTASQSEPAPKPSAQPSATAGPVGGTAAGAILISPEWLTSMNAKTGISQEALRAYAIAEIRAKRDKPGCKLAWNTLAGIGYVESQHGTIGGRTVLPDGRESSPIFGPVLDGGEFAAIADTDQGRLDGDGKWDRAVGPMQFIPSTWVRFAKDANADGVTDPQNVEDAALAAAEYLCYKGGDLTTAQGWTDSVLSYNHSSEYVRSVLNAANRYAADSRN